ncbi:MAG: hypothetical protein CMK74_00115 [Pseudomonadales bacterium]|jgi:hypothetical protein|nr:hypothetical protein [Pseudomonadales bacterium]
MRKPLPKAVRDRQPAGGRFIRLWTSVLRQAFADLETREHAAAARMWFASPSDLPCTCRWICDHLPVDHDRVQTMAADVVAGRRTVKERTTYSRRSAISP